MIEYLEIAPVYTDGDDGVQAYYGGEVPEGEEFYAFSVYARDNNGEFLEAKWVFDADTYEMAKAYAIKYASEAPNRAVQTLPIRDYVSTLKVLPVKRSQEGPPPYDAATRTGMYDYD